jgi:hypothetical protein
MRAEPMPYYRAMAKIVLPGFHADFFPLLHIAFLFPVDLNE